ncbi:hypothetical protein ACFLV6_00050 [Chloroflexota bacterium]
MSQFTNKDNNLCMAKLPCSYRNANICIFRVWGGAFLETLAMSDPENRTYYYSMIGVPVKPCLEPDEEKHNRGVRDILGLYTLGQKSNGELRNL